jgi:hypothetical protein
MCAASFPGMYHLGQFPVNNSGHTPVSALPNQSNGTFASARSLLSRCDDST